MARPKGIIRMKGTIGNISFYKRLGKDVARTPAGPSAEQIRNRKSCKRTRENINEFYQCAVQGAKTFRISLNALKHLWHPDLSGYLNKVFRNMVELSPGIRGQRPLQVLLHKELLKEFLFYPDRSFESISTFPYSLNWNADRNEASLSTLSFDGSKFINAPSGATHFRLLFAISVLSEYIFLNEGERYGVSDILANGKSSIASSEFISINAMVPAFSLAAKLTPAIVPASSSAVILSVGIEFYQETNGIYYLLKQQGCMKVAEVV